MSVPMSQDEIETTQGFSLEPWDSWDTESWDILRHGPDGKTLVVSRSGTTSTRSVAEVLASLFGREPDELSSLLERQPNPDV